MSVQRLRKRIQTQRLENLENLKNVENIENLDSISSPTEDVSEGADELQDAAAALHLAALHPPLLCLP